MNALRLYGRLAGVSVRSQLQYRASVVMQSIGAFLLSIIDFVGVWALFDRFGQLRGWRLPEIALFYGIVNVAWALTDAVGRGFDAFGSMVKDGGFDRVLLRPRSAALQLLGQELTVRRLGRLLQGALVLGYAVAALEVPWSAARILLLITAILGAGCAMLGLLVLQATSTFWTTETLEVWNAFTYGGLMMAQYPLPIYRSWFRAVFTFIIPLGCVSYLPGIAILGHADPLGTPLVVQWLAPLVGPGFLLLSLGLWRVGVRHYRSTGS
jgi:ABC-2 type transport system permease protein